MDLLGVMKSFIWQIFPPESEVERLLRTQFHHISSTNFFTSWKIRQSESSYKKWIHFQRNEILPINESFAYKPLISFFLAIEQYDLDLAKETIQSIKSQRNKNWELLIIGSPQLLTHIKSQYVEDENNRIRGYSITENPLPDLVKKSTGEYFICCKPGDIFENHFIEKTYEVLNSFPCADIIYSDIDEYSTKTATIVPLFKPDHYSPELHLSVNYLSRSLIKKSLAIEKVGLIISNSTLLYQEWDLLFLLKEKGAVDKHIPRVLIHQVQTDSIISEQGCQVIERHLHRTGIESEIFIACDPQIKIRWSYKQPSVSIIVPTKNNYVVLRNFIESLFLLTQYQNFEVILVDNSSSEERVKTYYSEIIKNHPIRIVNFNEPFNYSRANNLGASHSQSDLFLFMNNDMEIIHPDWLIELCQWATLPEIGVVGAKLLHMDNSIQHAGVVLGLQGFVGHLYLNAPEHYHGLAGSADWYRNYYAVTGACQMIRRETFYELGGFDEKFQLVFSDIDFCLRAIKKGYRNLYTPHTVLKHLEGKSRGYTSPNKDILRGFDLFLEWIQKEDPNFSPNLTYTAIPTCQWDTNAISRRSRQIAQKRKYIQRADDLKYKA